VPLNAMYARKMPSVQ